jgi:transposase, IS5 family
MKPKSPPRQDQNELFTTRLDSFIDHTHPLVRLAGKIDWAGLEDKVAPAFADTGRPAVPVRFMVGVLILKSVYDLSDEQVFERWVYDPYFQHFTGEEFFQHEVPHERSGLSHWRKRLGPDFVDVLVQESLRIALELGVLKGRDLERVTVDTTVEPKNVKFPTDANLLYTALVALTAQGRRAGLKLRQSYVRVGKRAQIMAQRYAHAKQMGWMPAFSEGIVMCQVCGVTATQRRGKHPWKRLPSSELIWQRMCFSCMGRQLTDLLCSARS